LRRKPTENCEDLLRIFAVAMRASFNEDPMRAKPGSGTQWHRRMNTESTRSVGSGSNNAPLIALPADHHGFALERWIEKLFNRDKERVHVDMTDEAVHMRNRRIRLVEWHRSPAAVPQDLKLLEYHSSLSTTCRELRLAIDIPAPSISGRPA
jgi:hypothetical protein